MEFKVIFRASFLEDLERVVRSIAVHNLEAARKLGETIVRTGESLRIFPERYPRVRQRPTVRRFIVKKHFKVFYRVLLEARIVEVLRCWDARRGTDPMIQW